MAKALKILVVILLGLVALLVIAALVVTWVVDPNDFKPRIQSVAREQANLNLDIKGDLDWSFWPSLGVEVGRTEARLVDEEELFAAIDEVTVGVAVWPLLFGRVELDGVLLDGMELNLVQGPEGGNWERIGAGAEQPAEPAAEPPPEEQQAEIALFVPRVTVKDARVRYRAPAENTDIVVEHVNLTAKDISLDEPFPVTGSLRYQDQNDMRVDTSFDLRVLADLDNNLYRVAPLKLDAEIGGLTSQPVKLQTTADTIEAALDEDRASVRGLVLTAANTRTTVGLDIQQLTGVPVFAGEIHTEPFDANMALRELGMEPIATASQDALKKVSFDATIGGEPNSLMLKPMTVKIDDSTLSGSAGVANLETGKLVFDLNLDKLVADGYLPPDTGIVEDESAEAPDSAGSSTGILPPLSDAPLLPVETLRGLLLDGTLTIGQLSAMNMTASDMAFAVKAENGVMALSKAEGKALSGSFSGQGRLDASQETPRLDISGKLDSVQLQPVAQFALDEDLFKGTLDMSMQLTSAGNSEQALVENARGSLDFSLADGTVRGVNLHNTLLSGVNSILGSFKVLTSFVPGQESGKLPAELSEDTKIVDMVGKARLEKEVAYVENLTAQLEKGTVTGKGYLNLRSQEFDLQFGMKSPEFGDNKYLGGRTWPLRCHGLLTGNPAKWCGYDKEGFQKIGKEIAAQAAKDKVRDKLGIEGEGDTANEVLRDAAEKKAKEKANEKLEEGLKKLFK